jgi:hypothetical protein
MKMRPLRVMRGIIITWCPSLLVRKLLHFNLFPETTGTIILKRGRSVHLIVLIKVFSSLGPKVQMSLSHHFVSVVRHPLNFHILIFSRTTGSNWTKLWCDTLWMLLFQNCVHWPCLILKMASHWLKNWKSLVVAGKRLKCKSVRTTGRDGHQVMIIPRITLKGLIFIQAHPYQYMKKHNKN